MTRKKGLTLALILMTFLTACGQGNNHSNFGKTNISDSDTILKTGWYYVSEQETNFKRQLDKSSDFYYINPNVIVSVEQFKELEITEDERQGTKISSLIIRFDKKGTENWSVATRNSIGRQVALIIDNELVSVSKVNAQIKVGVSSLFGFNYSKEELVEFVKLIGINDHDIYLPTPLLDGSISVEKALYNRRSHRDFQDKEISLEQLSQILWAAYGITLPRTDYDFLRGGFRTAPSAGGLYPLDIYIAVGKVRGITAGLYKYVVKGHKIVKILDEDIRVKLCSASYGQKTIEEAPISIVYTAIFSRTTDKYKERGRERYVCMDLGHSAENIYLQAEALGLGTCAIGAFSDEHVAKLLQLLQEEEPLCIMPVGYYNKSDE